jgi:hypothetical protein
VLADCGDGGCRGEQGGTLGGGGGAEAFAHGGAGAGVGHAVVEELVGPVGADGHGLDLVRQQRGAGFCGEVAGFLGFPNGAVEDGDPFAHDGGDAVADGTAAAVEFERGGGEETAAGEELLLDVRKPAVEQIPQTGQAFGRGQRGARDLIYKNLAGGFDGGQLQVFFRTEVGEERSSSARRPTVRPSRPSTEAMFTARRRMASRVRMPRAWCRGAGLRGARREAGMTGSVTQKNK